MLQRDVEKKVVDSSGSDDSEYSRRIFLVAEYQPVEATVLKVDAQQALLCCCHRKQNRIRLTTGAAVEATLDSDDLK